MALLKLQWKCFIISFIAAISGFRVGLNMALAANINHLHFLRFSVATSWEVNATGHSVVLPLKVCEELLQVIEDSNATLPASMRHMRAYKVRHNSKGQEIGS